MTSRSGQLPSQTAGGPLSQDAGLGSRECACERVPRFLRVTFGRVLALSQVLSIHVPRLASRAPVDTL